MTALLLAAALVLAFANGANDNFKGVATLYGARALSYRRALGLATASTLLGSLVSTVLASALVHTFSAKGLLPDAALTSAFLAAVALAAALTVLLATRLGLPISTTHALVGGLAGAGWIAAGPALDLRALGSTFFLPLAVGPLAAIVLASGALRAGATAARRAGIRYDTCVCTGGEWRPLLQVVSPAARGSVAAEALAVPALGLSIGHLPECQERYVGRVARVEAQTLVTAAHLLSASGVGFARGLNDTPKIVGLLVGAAVLSPASAALAIGTAMALGGLLAARRVARTLATRLTPMTPGQGLAGNLATSALVIGASGLGLPVSTTHVSTGGIFGIGLSTGELRRRASGGVLVAWFFTLPLAAALGALLALALG